MWDGIYRKNVQYSEYLSDDEFSKRKHGIEKKKKMEPARTIRLFVEQCVFVRLLQLLRRKTGFLENAQCKSERVQVARPAAGQQRNINC